MFVPQTHYLFGDSHADTKKCPPTWCNFGVQTNIKSIPLTSKHHWGDGSKVDPPPHTKTKVNRIDLIFVPTPKLHKVGGHFLATAFESPNKQCK